MATSLNSILEELSRSPDPRPILYYVIGNILNNFCFDGCARKCNLKSRTVAVDGENCDPTNLYRWLECAHVKNLEIDPRLHCTVQKW